MDSFLHNHQAALDSQREAQAIRDIFGDEDDKYFNHEYDLEDDDFSMIETPSLLSPCGSYQVDFFPIKGRSDLFLRCGVFEGLVEFQECVSHIEMFREVESKRFRKFRTIGKIKSRKKYQSKGVMLLRVF
ncbi:MAG: hypothetical protein CM15mV73_160 [Caudoviricetes sp.]|nr:MAG: hypothetical protein CM15mV73_160 [Caudoviricetes sp.]